MPLIIHAGFPNPKPNPISPEAAITPQKTQQLLQARGHLFREGSILSFSSAGGSLALRGSQTFQNPLIKEYTLNYNRIPNMISGIFLN